MLCGDSLHYTTHNAVLLYRKMTYNNINQPRENRVHVVTFTQQCGKEFLF